MAGDESNQIKWVGVRSTNPESNIPIIPPGGATTHQYGPGPWIATRNGTTRVQVSKVADANTTTTIIHTVTAGKTFYLTSYTVSVSPAALGVSQIIVRDTGDATVFTLGRIYTAANQWMALAGTLPMPLACPAGYDICIYSNQNAAVASIQGWEE